MKPIASLIVIAVSLLSFTAAAQVHNDALPAPSVYTVKFTSQHGEAYSVYMDGELQNRMPQGRVIVNNVSDQTHEVVVVLKRPEEKAAVLQLRPGEPNVTVNVNYDPRIGKLYLYTSAVNKPVEEEPLLVKRSATQRLVNRFATADEQSKPYERLVVADTVSADRLASMVEQMRSQSFDSDRLALGKSLISSAAFTSEQIAALVATIDYSQSQVEFLKYAYAYCLDKTNYSLAVNVLTYRADRQKVLDYVATQR